MIEDLKNNWTKWILVLPGAVIAGVLSTFPLHWVLYFTLENGETISGVNTAPIEQFLTPLVIALTFILVGYQLSPSYKFKASIILSCIYVLFMVAVWVFSTSQKLEISFSVKSLTPIIGLLAGVGICWIIEKK